MPLWDLNCPTCGYQKADVFVRLSEGPSLCPDGHECERVIFPGSSGPTMIPDTIPGGRIVENLGHHPVKIESRSHLKRELQARGLQEMVRHVGEQGSDKSKHTVRHI